MKHRFITKAKKTSILKNICINNKIKSPNGLLLPQLSSDKSIKTLEEWNFDINKSEKEKLEDEKINNEKIQNDKNVYFKIKL